jgi:hypothetical protein
VKIQNRVCRKDLPGIVGTVIAMQNGQAKVYWSSHTAQWVDIRALTLAGRRNDLKAAQIHKPHERTNAS